MSAKQGLPRFPQLVQDFFLKHLLNQRNASPRTVQSYRDTFRILLHFLEKELHKPSTRVRLEELDAPLVLAFLNYLEKQRGNSIRTRNARFAALRAFLKYAALQEPTSLPAIQRILAIPMKRFHRPLLGFLSRTEIEAILQAPNPSSWSGHRDQVLLTTMYNTGARVSEITSLRVRDVSLNPSPTVCIHGKGRKQRSLPLWNSTARCIRKWLKAISQEPDTPLFPNSRGSPLSRSGVESRLRAAVARASNQVPSLKKRHISPHTLRHTTAMHLLQSGVDITVIALWLGHENPATTHMYLQADLSMKSKALSKLHEPASSSLRYKPSDQLLQFLESL